MSRFDKVKKFVKGHLIDFIILLVFAVVFIVIHKTAGFYYTINDDTTMQQLASGNITGKPDGHLIFISYPLGVIIAGLFKVFPQYDWYGLTLLGCLFMCYILIAHRIFSLTKGKKNRYWIRCIGVVLLTFFLLDSSILFQFTVVAGVLGATAVFYLASSDNEIKTGEYILAWILLLLAGMVRPKVLLMNLPLAMVITVSKLAKKLRASECPRDKQGWLVRIKENHALIKRISIITIVGILSFFTIMKVNRAAYSETPWKEYSEYIHGRSLIMDYYGWPEYEGNQEFWNSIDVSKEEYECLCMYGILPNIDSEKIVAIGEYAKDTYSISFKERLSDMKGLFKTVVYSENCENTNIMLMLSICVLLLYAVRSDKFSRICIVGGVLIQVGIFVYLLYMGRMPARIVSIYEYQCILAVLGLLLAQKESVKFRFSIGYMLGLVCSVGLVVLSLFQKNEAVDVYRNKITLYNESMAYVSSFPEEYFFVLPTNTFITSKRFSFHDIKDGYPNAVGTYGWSMFSPWNEMKYQEYNLDRNTDILLEPDVYMLTTNMLNADRLNNYFCSKGLIERNYEVLSWHVFSDGRVVNVVRWYRK